MGQFSFGTDAVQIPPGSNIVLERLRVGSNDREDFRLHRSVSYTSTDAATGEAFSYTVPPDDVFESDLASVPQLLTWLVPRSGRHLPAALIHDALVDDPAIDRFEADRVFRDGMGDLDVGLVRRWIMWTAVSLKTIQKRGTTALRIGSVVSLVVIVTLGVLATTNLFVDTTLVPWMGSRTGRTGFVIELALGLAGATVIPIVLGVVLWRPIRIAGVIAGVSLAVLLHAMTAVAAVYGIYVAVERRSRRTQTVLAVVAVGAAVAGFAYGLITAVT